MTAVSLLAFFIRIFSIYLFLNSLLGSAQYLFILLRPDYPAGIAWGMGGIYLTGVGIAIYLWNRPVQIAKLLAPPGLDGDLSFDIDVKALEIAGFTIVGVFVLANSFPEMLLSAWQVLFLELKLELFQSVEVERNARYGNLVASMIHVMIGFGLCFYSGSVRLIIERLRGRT